MANSVTRQVVIPNRLGLHARPAMSLVDCASTFASDIRLARADRTDEQVDAKSIMQVMMLAATKGTAIDIIAQGDDAEAACEAIVKLVSDGFGED